MAILICFVCVCVYIYIYICVCVGVGGGKIILHCWFKSGFHWNIEEINPKIVLTLLNVLKA